MNKKYFLLRKNIAYMKNNFAFVNKKQWIFLIKILRKTNGNRVLRY